MLKIVLNEIEKEKIIDKLLKILSVKFNIIVNYQNTYKIKRQLFNDITTVLSPTKLSAEFFKLQNMLLSSEINEQGIVDYKNFEFKNNVSIYCGDITKLKIDAIVNAGNSKLLGCFVPNHGCIDNIIIQSGGFQIRNDLFKIMSKQGHDEKVGQAKVTKAYNLPSKYIIHTVGPKVHGVLSKQAKIELANCYISSLNLAKELKIKSIAFCCISTGCFNFPNDIACKIAVKTCLDWLNKTGYEIKIVFNVFKNVDYNLYSKEILEKNGTKI